MAIWLVRAGKTGEFERKFLDEGKIYLTWEKSDHDLSKLNSRKAVYESLQEDYPEEKKNTLNNWTSQVYSFVNEMKIADWVALPSKQKSAIHFGQIQGDYKYHTNAEYPFFHSRKVEWFAKDIPRSNFDQDILYSLGAFLTVCRISRNDSEERIKSMSKNNWRTTKGSSTPVDSESDVESHGLIDLEEFSGDQIAKFIIQKYKGHGMARIVEAILKAKGYVTYRSPEGPDKGVDILAAPEPLGFGKPRLCVQVKTGDAPVERTTLDQLLGSMQNFGAEQGLLVSWAGFKSSVDREVPSQFFRIRLWDQSAIINEFLSVYDKVDEDLKADLPLKRIWALNISEDELVD